MEHTSASPATVMYGHYCNLEEDARENGPIALACYVVLLEVAYDGSGMQRIMYGRRSTRIIRRDGCTLMLAKKLGIIRGYILKVSHLLPCTLSR